MNKYESCDNNTIRFPCQNIVYGQDHSQRQVFFPGTTALRQQQIPMQSINQHIQPNINSVYTFNQNYPQNYNQVIAQPNYYHLNQMINSHNYTQLQTNMIRPGVMYSQSQPPHIYHSMEKINPNNQPNYIMTPNYYQPAPQITHHITNQISPIIQPQHIPQSQHPQITNQYPVGQPPRPFITQNIQNDNFKKGSSALVIINPETNQLIDLTSYKKDLQNEKNNENNIEKDFRDPHSDSSKYPGACININDFHNVEPLKEECHDTVIKLESTHNHHDKKEYCEQIENLADQEVEVFKSECSESELKACIDSETAVHSPINLPFESSQQNLNFKNTIESQTFNEETDLLDKNSENNLIVIKSDDLSEDMEFISNKLPQNKFIYSRDELIKIGKKELSQQKPKGLPVKEEFTDPIILDHSNNISGLENVESIQFINQKFNKVHKMSQGSSVSWRHLNIKNTHSVPKYINLGNTESVLSRSDDGYITCKQRLAAGEELSETEELIRQIKGILNRIVPQNFDQCLEDLVSLKIGTHEGMTCLVNELFLKAVKEEAYSVTFAKICYYLVNIKADVSENEIVTFRSALLQKCQAMFTTPLEEQLEKVRQDWLLKASCEKPKTKALMESDVGEQIKKAKDRYYGNIRFIGELYLKGVLITKIIIFCIENLLTKENDSDSLICLCKLLETCGAKLESEIKGKEKLNESFKKLRTLSESSIETRVRFRILDIMEMRQKKWCLRKVQQEQKIQPKTLEEIKIEKENEEVKEYSSTLNRRAPSNWNADRRPSLPNSNKNRSNFAPRQLTVTCSNDSTTLGPQKRNWSVGSGAAFTSNPADNEKKINKQKLKLNTDIRSKDSFCETENQDLTQSVEGCGSNYGICILPTQSFNVLTCQSRNSSENSSRSSSHGRSTPQIISKEKLPNSKLAQSISIDAPILSPGELFKEYTKTSEFCEESWNAYTDKVDVVHQWLDSNFDTDCDNRTSLSNLLSMLINQNLLVKRDLLNAFSKLIESLEDLIIDIGPRFGDSLSDYFIPFLESMEHESIDLIESIFDFEALKMFDTKYASIIYSLPWSMSNKIMKLINRDNCRDIFKIASDSLEQLSNCEEKLILIISKNLFRAINIVSQINPESYLNWIVARYEESINCFGEMFFISLNWEEMFNQIQIDSNSATKYAECFKHLSQYSKNNEIIKALCKLSGKNDKKGIFSVIRCLIVTNTYDIQTVLSWESTFLTVPVSSILKDVLTVIKNKSAFISDSSFESLFDESNDNYFNQLTIDNINCTKSDSY